ncbi:MAG: hypothetical protein WCB18_02050 [Thermoplasmata archaeon]
MVFLFRRFRKEKKDETATPAAEPAPPVEKPIDPASGEPSVVPPAPGPGPEPPDPKPEPSSPPPPLPTTTPIPGPLAPAAPSATCFLCGTPLEDHYCPKCQMTWVE